MKPIKQTFWSKPYNFYVHLNGSEEVLDKFIRALIRKANAADRKSWGQLKTQGIKRSAVLHYRMRESLQVILSQEDLPKYPGNRHYCVLCNTFQFKRDAPHLAEMIIKLATEQQVGCSVKLDLQQGYSVFGSDEDLWHKQTVTFTSYINKYYRDVYSRLDIYLHRTHGDLPDQQFTADTTGGCECSTLPCVASTSDTNSK